MGADSVGADIECPFSGVTEAGSLEKGSGKRCSESEGTPYLRAAVHRHCQRRPKGLGTDKTGSKVRRTSSISIQTIQSDFIHDGVCNVDGYKRKAWYNLNCLRQTYCCLSSSDTDLRPHQLWKWFEEGSCKPVRAIWGMDSPPPSLLKQTVCVDVGRRGSVVLLSGTSCYPATHRSCPNRLVCEAVE